MPKVLVVYNSWDMTPELDNMLKELSSSIPQEDIFFYNSQNSELNAAIAKYKSLESSTPSQFFNGQTFKVRAFITVFVDNFAGKLKIWNEWDLAPNLNKGGVYNSIKIYVLKLFADSKPPVVPSSGANNTSTPQPPANKPTTAGQFSPWLIGGVILGLFLIWKK